MAFETTGEATRLWIKGREFTVAQLLGDAYKDQAERYVGGALVIFRLAPQDYHRFHSPVDGTIGPMTYIPGEYYTVNVRNVLAKICFDSRVIFAATSDPDDVGRLWRERAQDCAD
jgi:phosphatidylserine decarboxylase